MFLLWQSAPKWFLTVLSVTWNGRAVTRPLVILWKELSFADYQTATVGNLDSRGALVCRSDKGRPFWEYPSGGSVPIAPKRISSFIQAVRRPGVARLYRGRQRIQVRQEINAVFRCRTSRRSLYLVALISESSS